MQCHTKQFSPPKGVDRMSRMRQRGRMNKKWRSGVVGFLLGLNLLLLKFVLLFFLGFGLRLLVLNGGDGRSCNNSLPLAFTRSLGSLDGLGGPGGLRSLRGFGGRRQASGSGGDDSVRIVGRDLLELLLKSLNRVLVPTADLELGLDRQPLRSL